MNYYFADNGQQRGPFPPEQLTGQGVKPDTLVWAEGMPGWVRADQVPELRPVLGLPPLAGPVATASPTTHAAYAAIPPTPSGQPYAPQPTYFPPGSVPPVAYGNPYQSVNGKRMGAGLTAIILGVLGFGGLGIHKFILGFNTAGIIYILVSVLGGIVTCGVSAVAMSIISIVEGILYLTKSDEQFYNEYVVGKKQWF